MSTSLPKRTRSERVAALELPPGILDRTFKYLQRGDVLLRLGMCALTAMILWTVTGAWKPPMPFRTGFTPTRGIAARVTFRKPDPQATKDAKEQARKRVLSIYDHDPYQLKQLRAALQNRVVEVIGAKTLKELKPGVWDEFFGPQAPGDKPLSDAEKQRHFEAFHQALPDQDAIKKLEKDVASAMAPIEERGLLENLPEDATQGNQQEIMIHPPKRPEEQKTVAVNDVQIGEITSENPEDPDNSLENRLVTQIQSREVASRVYDWLRPRLREHTTLKLNQEETQAAQRAAVDRVEEQYITYEQGTLLVPPDQPINVSLKPGEPAPDHLSLLKLEHDAYVRQLTRVERVGYSLAALGMFVALSILCGVYVLCYEPRLISSIRRFATMLALVIVAVGAAVLASEDAWRAEAIPLLLFAMTVAIAYHQEMALLFSAAVALIIVAATGHGLGHFTVLTAAAASAILLVGRIRSRRKLIYVGTCVGVVALLTTLGVGTLIDEQPF